VNGDGTAFEIVNNGTVAVPNYASTPTTLVSFSGTNDAALPQPDPFGSLIADAAGDLFGTTYGGGANDDGTVFEIAKTFRGSYTLTTLFSFNGANGAGPAASLIADANGDLFGTTEQGGANGAGTVFEIVNYGTVAVPSYASTPTILVSFNGAYDGSNGADPHGSLIADAYGDLFGTTAAGGTDDAGTVFEIARTSLTGYASTPTILISLNGSNGGTNGFDPLGSLIADANGDLFGTTIGGGANGDGTVFEVTGTGFQVLPTSQGLTTDEQQVEAMYVAYFGRAGDPAGTYYWMGNLDTGQTIDDVAMNFANQTES
jgi:uncharacterized repeat protein (TIGR03803 family)